MITGRARLGTEDARLGGSSKNKAAFDISHLSEQNQWWIDEKNISKDYSLNKLKKFRFQWSPRLKDHIKLDHDVIYTIRGPRQVGKTTLMKLIIKDLLSEKKAKPEDVFFWSCERNDAKELNAVIQTYLDWRVLSKDNRKYIFLDEICSVKNWSNELIYFANKGSFQNCTIIVTGSHSMDMKRSTERMPGRRGGDGSGPLDKILLPMKFAEFVELVYPELRSKLEALKLSEKEERYPKIKKLFEGKIDRSIEDLMVHKKQLDALFEEYLLTGGIPVAINELKEKGSISENTYAIYLKAIIGNLRKYRHKENTFKQIAREALRTLSTPVSWNSFAGEKTGIKSPKTVGEYAEALEELYVANISYRCKTHNRELLSDYKKIYFLDPFIFHALHGWSNEKKNYFKNAKDSILKNTEMKSKFVESVVYSHLCRFAYNLYLKDLFDPKSVLFYYRDKKNKEVDFVLSFDGKYYPFEVKYQANVSSSDFVGFSSFGKGVMISKNELRLWGRYVSIPLSIFLMLV